MMEYKGYVGKVEFDDEANIFHGEVINLRDVVTFQGRTVAQLRKAFKDSVDDYLEFCSERGEEPDKPFSGKFMVRIEPELHKAIAAHARVENKSLNAWVHDVLEDAAADDLEYRENTKSGMSQMTAKEPKAVYRRKKRGRRSR